MPEALVRWEGELLWPAEPPVAEVIDLGGVAALGTWAHAWFAARPGQGVCNASPRLRAQLEAAGCPVRWVDPPRPQPGLTRAERDLLLG